MYSYINKLMLAKSECTLTQHTPPKHKVFKITQWSKDRKLIIDIVWNLNVSQSLMCWELGLRHCWEMIEPLWGKAYWKEVRSMGTWLEGDIGTLSSSFSLSLSRFQKWRKASAFILLSLAHLALTWWFQIPCIFLQTT
jgi:hypothetical protein